MAIIEVVTPALTDDQQGAIHQLPNHVAAAASNRMPRAGEIHTAFDFPPEELTLESLRALSAEVSRIAGAARLEYTDDDQAVRQLVDEANAG